MRAWITSSTATTTGADLGPSPRPPLSIGAPGALQARKGASLAWLNDVANALGITLPLSDPTLSRTEATPRSSDPSHPIDPRSTTFGRELFATMVRGASAQRAEHTEVSPTRTQLSGSEAASALRSAWTRLFGETPSDSTVSVLVAQWAHETGGGASMFNYNFGGLKGSSPSGMATAYWTHEGSGADTQKIKAHFRAYQTAADGAADYLHLLSTRFPSAMEAAHRGNASDFVHALKQSGYFTDSEANYSRSVCALTERVRSQGYDAVGHSTAGTQGAQSTDTVTKARYDAHLSPAWSSNAVASGTEVSPLQVARAIDVAAMGDELARAALRIAMSEPQKDDET